MQLNLNISHTFTDPGMFAAFALDFADLADKYPDIFDAPAVQAKRPAAPVNMPSTKSEPPAPPAPPVDAPASAPAPRKGRGRPRKADSEAKTPTVADKVQELPLAAPAVQAPAGEPIPPKPESAPVQAPPASAPAPGSAADLQSAFLDCVSVVGKERMYSEVLKELGVSSPSAIAEADWPKAIATFKKFAGK